MDEKHPWNYLEKDPEIELEEEILPWMTETEQKIVKSALKRRKEGKLLSIVEEVVLREYEIKLQAKKSEKDPP